MVFLIGVCATFIGSMTGLGGGIIIKPLLSLTSSIGAVEVNFLAASAVFVMAFFNSIVSYKNGHLKYVKGLEWLILGAMFGGNVGALLFEFVVGSLIADGVVVIQAWLLLFTLGLLYFLNGRDGLFRVKSSWFAMFSCGLMMSVVSSFLGIGGGPLNIYVFRKILGFDLKSSVVLSLVTIFFCQITALITMFDSVVLSSEFLVSVFSICCAGIIGAVFGSRLFVVINEVVVKRLYNTALLFVVVLNILIIFK